MHDAAVARGVGAQEITELLLPPAATTITVFHGVWQGFVPNDISMLALSITIWIFHLILRGVALIALIFFNTSAIAGGALPEL